MAKRWQPGELKAKVAEICRAGGIPANDAGMIADVLVTTDMRGIHSHGVVRLARYLDCIRAGGIQPAAEPVTLSESANSIMASAAGCWTRPRRAPSPLRRSTIRTTMARRDTTR